MAVTAALEDHGGIRVRAQESKRYSVFVREAERSGIEMQIGVFCGPIFGVSSSAVSSISWPLGLLPSAFPLARNSI